MTRFGVSAALVAAVVGSEFVCWLVSSRLPAARPTVSTSILVLGYPSRSDGRVHFVQRWRTQIGVRTLEAVGDGLLGFSGGPTRGAARSEAAVMAAYASDELGVSPDLIVLEESARSTWENISKSIPLLASADQIVIASDPLHAEKARRYLSHQSPELAGRLIRAADYRLFERWWLKLVTVANYLRLRASRSFGVPPAWAARDVSESGTLGFE